MSIWQMARQLKFRHWLFLSAIPMLAAALPIALLFGWAHGLAVGSLAIIAVSFAALLTPEPPTFGILPSNDDEHHL